jgi:hypothetical protein
MDGLGVQAWIGVHGGVIAGVELLGGEQFGDVANHIEVIIDPLAAKHESIASIQKSFLNALS